MDVCAADAKKSRLLSFLKEYYPLLILFFIVFGLSFLASTVYQDDAYFKEVFERDWNYDIFAFMDDHYRTWSSRLIIEPITILCLEMPLLWRFAQSLITILLSYSLYRIVGKKNILILLSACLISLIYPLVYNYEMGFVTTSQNYFWTMTLCLYITSLLVRQYRNEKVPLYSLILALLASLYCTNEEVMAVATLAITLVFSIIFYLRREKYWLSYAALLIALTELIFALTCPGNQARYDASVASFFPSFNDVSFFSKIAMGYYRMSASFAFADSWPMILLLSCLSLLVFMSKKTPLWLKIISLIPVLAVVVFGLVLKYVPSENSPYDWVWNFAYAIENTRAVPDMSNPTFYIPCLAFTLLLSIIIVDIITLYPFKWKGLFLIGILILGLGTQLGLALSPSSTFALVFSSQASGNVYTHRSESFFAMSLLVLSALLIKDIALCQNKKIIYSFSISLSLITIVCFALYSIDCHNVGASLI